MINMLGLSAFPITPSDADGCVDRSALRSLIRPLIAAEVDSVGLLGSTGSYPYLPRTERRRTLETAIEEAGGAVPTLVGVGALRIDEAIHLAQDAKAIGASAGLLAPVSYTPLTDDEVFEHFSSVARESGLPLYIYDNPGTTHFTFRPSLVERLSTVLGIIGIKCPAPAADGVAVHLRELRAAVPSEFSIGYSAFMPSHSAIAPLMGNFAILLGE
jgi:4-hydroxy-tetrahydrodipicolinate synthase